MDSAADTFILKLIMLCVQTAEEWIEVEGKRGFTLLYGFVSSGPSG